MNKIEALIKVVIDGQAYLYAQHFKLMAELMGQEISEEEFQKWEDEWKEQTSELVKGLIFDYTEENNEQK